MGDNGEISDSRDEVTIQNNPLSPKSTTSSVDAGSNDEAQYSSFVGVMAELENVLASKFTCIILSMKYLSVQYFNCLFSEPSANR